MKLQKGDLVIADCNCGKFHLVKVSEIVNDWLVWTEKLQCGWLADFEISKLKRATELAKALYNYE